MLGIKSWIQKKINAEDENDLKKLLVQFIKFGIVGISNTLVSWGCYYFVLWVDEDWYLFGGILGTIVSIANAFFWNDRYVFSGGKRDWKSKMIRLGKTYISYGGTSLLGMLLLWMEVDWMRLSKVWAPPINLIITIPLNFLINKLWTFKKQE